MSKTKPNEPTLTCSEPTNCQRCGSPRRKVKDIKWYPCTNPACKDFEPASCSEVVERLAGCIYGADDTCGLDLDKAEKILREWREQIRKGGDGEAK